MKILMFFSLLFLGGILLGCLEQPQQATPSSSEPTQVTITENSQPEVEYITISGIEGVRDISSIKPVELIVSGSSNQVNVLDGTEVRRIVLSGTNNVLILPANAQPEIIESGVNNLIQRR